MDEEPDETLVYLVKFGIAMTVAFQRLKSPTWLSCTSWNSEVFSAITGLTGIMIGVFVGRKT